MVWIIGQFVGKKKEEDGEAEPTSGKGSPMQGPDDIRREIMRKIRERQQSKQEPEAIPRGEKPPMQPSEPQQTPQPVKQQSEPSPVVIAEPEVDVGGDMIAQEQRKLAALQDKMAQAQQRANVDLKAMNAMAKQENAAVDANYRMSSFMGSAFSRELLQSPEGLRSAFLYSEILAKPVGAR